MKIGKIALAVLSAAGVAAGGAAVMPGVGSVLDNGGTTLIGTPAGTVSVTPLKEGIFKISRVPPGAGSYSLPVSQASVLEADGTGIRREATGTEMVFRSSTTELRVDRTTGRVTFLTLSGDTLLSEAGGVDNSGEIKRVSLKTGAGENLYGAGERGHKLRLNGDTLVMYNRQNYGYGEGDPRISQMGITVPWYVSDAGYGVLFDDYNRATLTLGKDSVVYESETPKPLSYYFVNGGGSLAGAVSGYASLTGHQPLPPLWALGYITSRYGYHNEQEALGAIDSLKTRGYPVDGIVFDLYWYGQETDMGRLEWNKNQFPDHRRMLDSLKNMGVHTVLINQPYINKKGAIDNYKLLKEAGLLAKDSAGNNHDVTIWVGESGMFDMSNPSTREWIWNRLRDLTAEGVEGWWGDLGEPEVHPLSIVHNNGEKASEYHNVWGNEWSRTIYDGLRADFPEMRPLLMMRGGTAGLQRYGVFPWTTDVARSWAGFQPQVKLMLNSGLSGLGYMGSDVGGFAVDEKDPYQPELYVRWLQMGTFSPMLRTHAQQKPEPYHYPQYDAIIKEFVKMRYRWLPYNYTLAYENASSGLPLARPLNFTGGSGSKHARVEDEYLWGEEVLVAPVFKKGAKSRTVLFPEGSKWIDWNNPSLSYAGGSKAAVSAPLDKLPLFVKAGSFIPQYDREIANTGEYDPSELTVKYFASPEETSYTLFDDDRRDPESLVKGAYQLVRFEGKSTGKSGKITIASEGMYPGMPESRMLEIEVIGTGRPASLTVNGSKRTFGYEVSTKTLTVKVELEGKPVEIAWK